LAVTRIIRIIYGRSMRVATLLLSYYHILLKYKGVIAVKWIFYLPLLFLLILPIALLSGKSTYGGILLILFFTTLALACMRHAVLKNFAFTVWVLAFVCASMLYPNLFGSWFNVNLAILIVPLIQIIMFGMGTTLNLKDFTRIVTMPWPVFIGIFLQFTVMPLVGYAIAMTWGFEPEIAAGIILIGSCSGGVASNLMTYLAGGNVALSVTMTSCSTLVSPLMTPFLMQTLAGKLVPIDFMAMMLSILNMIIVPIVAGIIANKILYSKKDIYNQYLPLSGITLACIVLAIGSGILKTENFGLFSALKSGLVIGFLLIAIVALAKIIISLWLKGPATWMDKALPLVSMAGICFIIGIITARSSEQLLTVGLALIAAAVIHNFIGYTAGYWLAKLLRQDERTCRTISFEVGMQNGGMASGLAMSVLNSVKAALAPAIFGPWMNVSGSVLANWWQRTADRRPETGIKIKEKRQKIKKGGKMGVA
jgi:BASS family bile acid:Na+ symporter